MLWLIIIIIIGWLICSVLTYGITLAHLDGESPGLDYVGDKGFAAVFSLLGPIGLLMSFLMSGFAHYGLKYKR